MIEKNELSKNARGGTELMLEGLEEHVPRQLLDGFQIIPSRVRQIDPSRKAILWLHDLPNDPEAQHLANAHSRDRFAGLVFVSHWQMQMFNVILGVPYSKSVVLQNAITPLPEHSKISDGVIRLIYHTTPHRGLAILVPVFERLADFFRQRGVTIHLDVYSSFRIYGWDHRDKPYEELFRRCAEHPDITYHGAVSNEEVRTALERSDIFGYPSIWPETSCIAAIEALSAKNLVVCPNYAALPETLAGFGLMYQWTEDHDEHANRFANHLAKAIQLVKEMKQGNGGVAQLNFQKTYADRFYGWRARARQWTEYLTSLNRR